MYRVYSGSANIAKLNIIERGADLWQICGAYVLAHTAQGEVWGKGAFFLFISQATRACFNAFLQGGHICRSVESDP